MLVLILIEALLYTAVLSLFATLLNFPIAKKIGAIDVPTDSRRMHRLPTPRLGGLSIFVAFLTVAFAMQKIIAPEFLFLSLGAIIIVTIGIIDDSTGLSPYFKLLCQAVSATIFLFPLNSLYIISPIDNIGFFIFILTLINAHNFIDGLDGLCTGISVFESLSLGIIFILIGRPDVSLVAFIICGACIGFLPYNYKNAKMFMGDTGSTFLGYSFGALTTLLFLNSNQENEVLSVLFIFLVPLFDIFLAVARRISKGRNPFSPDRSHIHHILCDIGLGHRKTSLLLRMVALFFSLVGVALFVVSK